MRVARIELRKQLRGLYNPRAGEVELVKVPAMKYIIVDGDGAPGGESFQQAMGVIYNLVYTMKFRAKRLLKKDYDVMAPEGLWWTKGKTIDLARPDKWLWSLMVVVPDFVNDRLFSETVEEVRRKKNPPGLEKARFEALEEGQCVQIMHVGPNAAEPESIAKMEAYANEHG